MEEIGFELSQLAQSLSPIIVPHKLPPYIFYSTINIYGIVSQIV
jgi:hypothetical protein